MKDNRKIEYAEHTVKKIFIPLNEEDDETDVVDDINFNHIDPFSTIVTTIFKYKE